MRIQTKPARTLPFTNAVLVLCFVLPLVVPFYLARNIDVQASLVIVTGLLAWIGVLRNRPTLGMSRFELCLLLIYLGFCLVSLLVHPSVVNLYGSYLARLGTLELLACVGCGLVLSNIPAKHLMLAAYASSCAVALASIPFVIAAGTTTVRLGGLFHQSDVLAVWMGCGLIFGIGLAALYPHYRTLLVLPQLVLASVLLLSQTRAVIGLLVLIALVATLTSQLPLSAKIKIILLVVSGVVITAFITQSVFPKRFTNTTDAYQSTRYRLDLQLYGVKAVTHNALWGYGTGSLPDALNCPSLHSPALQHTCHVGFYFDSSHNIYIDRALGVGLVGGLSFLTLIVVALKRGLVQHSNEKYFAYALLLISLYYFTNVTSVSVELLLWIFLFRSFKSDA